MTKSRQSANLVSKNNIFSDITNSRVGVGTTVPIGQLQVSSGPVIIGSATSTGTASQRLQVTGGAYVSGSVGIGTTNPTQKLTVSGDVSIASTVGIGTIINIVPYDTLNSGTLSWEGSAGQLFSITNNLTTGSIFSVNDVSGIPSIDVDANGTVELAPFNGNVGVGTTRPTSKFQVVGGDSEFEGVIETVGTATTYMVGSGMVLEMDVRRATVYTYTMPTGANIGIVSFKNMPAQTGSPAGSTVTLLVTQNSAGTGNTTAATGIGTNCTVVGYENGAPVAGISTRGLVGSATTVTLSSTGSDVDFVSFFINYTGATNTAASSYKVYVTKNGGFRRGNVGV